MVTRKVHHGAEGRSPISQKDRYERYIAYQKKVKVVKYKSNNISGQLKFTGAKCGSQPQDRVCERAIITALGRADGNQLNCAADPSPGATWEWSPTTWFDVRHTAFPGTAPALTLWP